MHALERRDRLDRALQQSRKLPASPLDRLRSFVGRRTLDRLFTPTVRGGCRNLFGGLVPALAAPRLRRLLFGGRRLLSLLRGLVAGIGVRRLLLGRRRLLSIGRRLGLVLFVPGGERSGRR